MPPAREFFQQPVTICARELLGGSVMLGKTAGRIIETEAYCSGTDPACHTFFRTKARAFVEDHPAGTAYIYLNYGIHWMLNVLVCPPDGPPGFVLVRALAPTEGLPLMERRRGTAKTSAFCSGPGKLTVALGINGGLHGIDLCSPGCAMQLRVPSESPASETVLIGPRIGISRAQEFPWRFGLDVPDLSRPFPRKI